MSVMCLALSRLRVAYGVALRRGKSLRPAICVLFAAILQFSWVAAAQAEGLRLVAIGDSLTAGFGLPQDQGFVPQLDAWLAENGHPEVEVVNMGVSGDTSAGGVARLDWALREGADAVMIALGGNDLLRGIQPAETRANLAKMLTELDQRGLPALLAGLEAPLNFGPDYKRDFDALYPELAAEYDAVHHPSFVDALFREEGLAQADGLHPNGKGVARMVEAIGPRVLELLERAQP